MRGCIPSNGACDLRLERKHVSLQMKQCSIYVRVCESRNHALRGRLSETPRRIRLGCMEPETAYLEYGGAA